MTIEVTEVELEMIIKGLETIISDYCCTFKSEEPYKNLIDKLQGGNGSVTVFKLV